MSTGDFISHVSRIHMKYRHYKRCGHKAFNILMKAKSLYVPYSLISGGHIFSKFI